jgi:hypothetical protein
MFSNDKSKEQSFGDLLLFDVLPFGEKVNYFSLEYCGGNDWPGGRETKPEKNQEDKGLLS